MAANLTLLPSYSKEKTTVLYFTLREIREEITVAHLCTFGSSIVSRRIEGEQESFDPIRTLEVHPTRRYRCYSTVFTNLDVVEERNLEHI